jgi:proton-translocating NAD(P)+ transhydrogenase subunit alpha
MKIAIPKERKSKEFRVAASPETVKQMVKLGAGIIIESGAGNESSFSDASYVAAGATITKDIDATLKEADIVLKVRAPVPKDEKLDAYKKGAILIGILDPHDNKSLSDYAKHDITSFALELVPRITRAQTMDILSSQSNLAGYKSVLDAASEFGRAFPMMMTAAGTIPPARVLVMGAGVAGLQAIATAKRLGAIVSAFDVRPAAKEQVESLGGKFIEVDAPETDAETTGGYAKEMNDEYKRLQQEKIIETIKTQDIVITTALIPGKTAPILVTKEMVQSMKPGSVIVDLAAERGGNCELSKLGKITTTKGVKIIAHENMPSRLASDASRLYARNLLNFLDLIIDNKSIKIQEDDEIIKATMITHQGQIVHEQFKTS